jgi:hypothetical protein
MGCGGVSRYEFPNSLAWQGFARREFVVALRNEFGKRDAFVRLAHV